MRQRMQWLIGLVSVMMTAPAMAFHWQDIWQRPDQQGAVALQANQPALAATLFTTPNWQAVAHYRAEQYPQAYQTFSHDNTAQGYYNRANTSVYMGKYEEAIKEYTIALQQQPDMEDAKYNKELVENFLKKQKDNPQQDQQQQDQQQQNPQQDPQQQEKQQQQQDQQDSSQQPQEKQQNGQQQQNDQSQQDSQQQNQPQNDQQKQDQQDQQKQQQDQQDSGQQPQEKQQNGQQQQNNQSQQDSQQQNQPQSNQQNQQSNSNVSASRAQSQQQSAQNDPTQQATEQWLQSVPDDPGGLLKQKFLRDHANYEQLRSQGLSPW